MNDELIVVLSVAIVTYLVLSNDKAKIESMTGGSDELLNIYDEPLEACPDNQYESNGSWMGGNKCSERGGGVHQICYRDIGTNANKFSQNTGQSDWSTDRGDQNHCVCLGAWALYKKKLDEGLITDDNSTSRLKCSAIPNYAFSEEYVNKFSTWNGNEIPGQIVNGVEGIVEECLKDADADTGKKSNLLNNYCKFAEKVSDLKYKKDVNGNFTDELNEFYKDYCGN